MKPVACWMLVSAGTLAAVECVLLVSKDTTYTGLYQRARRSRHGWVPVVAAVAVVAHLEGWLPERVDPFTVAGTLARRWLP